jgi:integrase
MQFLNMDQIADIMRVAYKRSTRDHLILLLSFQHGMRVSEVTRLTLADVEGGKIRIERLKGSLATEHNLMTDDNVLFNGLLALHRWLQERPADGVALFPGRWGGFMRPDSVRHLAVHYMELARVPAELAHHHSLKHACCSIQSEKGIGIEYIAAHVGHKEIKNTRIYLNNITGEKASEMAMNAFHSALGGK